MLEKLAKLLNTKLAHFCWKIAPPLCERNNRKERTRITRGEEQVNGSKHHNKEEEVAHGRPGQLLCSRELSPSLPPAIATHREGCSQGSISILLTAQSTKKILMHLRGEQTANRTHDLATMYVCMFFDTITLDFQTPRPTHPPNVRLQFRLSVNDDVTLIVDSPALGAAEIVLSQSKYMVVIGHQVDCAIYIDRQEREPCHERAQHRMKTGPPARGNKCRKLRKV